MRNVSTRTFRSALLALAVGTLFYIVDKHGVVRYSLAGSYVVEGASRPIPSNEEIVQELKRCEGNHEAGLRAGAGSESESTHQQPRG